MDGLGLSTGMNGEKIGWLDPAPSYCGGKRGGPGEGPKTGPGPGLGPELGPVASRRFFHSVDAAGVAGGSVCRLTEIGAAAKS